MQKITEQQFAMLCFLVRMQDLQHTFMPYIESQANLLLPLGYGAFAHLDKVEQTFVMGWLETWEYEVPKYVKRTFAYT